MKKKKEILKIIDEPINYPEGSPIELSIADIRHITPHMHSKSAEVVFCLEGNVNLVCNYERLQLSAGEMFTIFFDDIHCLYSDCSNRILLVHMDLDNLSVPFKEISETYVVCEDVSCRNEQRDQLLQMKLYILTMTYKYLSNSGEDKNIAAAANIIMEHMVKEFDWFRPAYDSFFDNEEIMLRFRELVHFCENRYSEKLTISALSETVHINQNYLSQFFNKTPIKSFSNLVSFMRCFYAQFMLLETDKSINEISSLCGFSDSKYFYKNFRLLWEMTPAEFRSWFREYIKTPDKVTYIKKEQACRFMKSYIMDFLTEKMFPKA